MSWVRAVQLRAIAYGLILGLFSGTANPVTWDGLSGVHFHLRR
jgi:hypothetical protein